MVTQLVAGRVFDYARTVGRGGISGAGFNSPADVALGDEDYVYVLNRGWEFVTNVRGTAQPGAPASASSPSAMTTATRSSSLSSASTATARAR